MNLLMFICAVNFIAVVGVCVYFTGKIKDIKETGASVPVTQPTPTPVPTPAPQPTTVPQLLEGVNRSAFSILYGEK